MKAFHQSYIILQDLTLNTTATDGLKGSKSSAFYLRVTPAVGRSPSMVTL